MTLHVYLLRVILYALLSCVATATYSQTKKFVVKGYVKEASHSTPMEYAMIELREQANNRLVGSCITDKDGKFQITTNKTGVFVLKASFMGYETANIKNLSIKNEYEIFQNIFLKEDSVSLETIIVKGLSESEKVSKLAYNVQVLETDKLSNTTMELDKAIDKISGVKIRKDGGLGSDANISLNGFSGRHVKVFIDGVPMEGMGSAFDLNNIPTGYAKRIEVYKGVVPIELGGDALGGAINIVTDNSKHTRVNASYSYGSFNTHKSNILAEHTSNNGLYISFNAYQNYSDNDYKVNVRILDLETGNYKEGYQKVRRFHGMYHNEAAVLKIGVVDKPYADRLLLGFIGGYEYKQIQNASDMNFVFGARYNTATTIMPSLSYEKRFKILKGLNISLNGNYNFGKAYAADTARGTYNWLGEFKPSAIPGELSYMKYHYRDRNGAANFRSVFYPAENHSISLSSTFTSFSRKGRNEASPSEKDKYPQESFKNVSGISYKYNHNDVWNISAFIKNYLNNIQAYLDYKGDKNYKKYTSTQSYWGGGMASTYFISPDIQLKASYEHAYRLPTSKEYFGSGDGIEVGNTDIRPESSDNVNLGITFAAINRNGHNLTTDITLQYRNVNDYIRRTVSQTQGTATSSNEGRIRNIGFDMGCRYTFKKRFFVGANFSYFDMRNMTKFKPGTHVESTIYKDRIPNQPYMYGNADAGCTFTNIFTKNDNLDIHYMMNYIHKFYFDWPSYGGANIPSQFSHDLYISYTFGKKHNLCCSAECTNIFDEQLYDHYNVQKPGRAFALKLSYNFNSK